MGGGAGDGDGGLDTIQEGVEDEEGNGADAIDVSEAGGEGEPMAKKTKVDVCGGADD